MEGREHLWHRYLLRQSVPDMGSSNGERAVTDCWTSDRWHQRCLE